MVLLLSLALGLISPAPPLAQKDCITVRTEARYVAYAYDHYVHVTNNCKAAVQCAVSSNANPKPTSLQVPQGKTVGVRIFRGSPARTFTPKVSCRPAASR